MLFKHILAIHIMIFFLLQVVKIIGGGGQNDMFPPMFSLGGGLPPPPAGSTPHILYHVSINRSIDSCETLCTLLEDKITYYCDHSATIDFVFDIL